MPVRPLRWTNEGHCVHLGNRLFFSEEPDLQKIAKDICMDCPVKLTCLEYAVATDQRFGVWGGLNRRERINLRRRRGRRARREAS